MSARAADDAGDAPALASALGALGIACRVEPRHGLALLTAGVADAARLADSTTRRDVLALATQHGFTHIAVELVADPDERSAPLFRP